MKIRVVTYNLRSGLEGHREDDPTAGLEAVAEVLNALQQGAAQPEHFVALVQEIETGARRTGCVDQPAWLKERLGWETDLFFPAFERQMRHQDRDSVWRYGNALLTPATLDHAPDVRLQPLPRTDYRTAHPDWPAWIGEPRVAAHVTIALHAQPLQICCTHLGVTPDQRELQRAAIAGYLVRSREEGRPVIVGGDFNVGIDHTHFVDQPPNMTPRAAPRDELADLCARAGLVDVLARVSAEDRTYPTPQPTFSLDRIMVSENFRIDAAGVHNDGPNAASDHFAVFADLTLATAGK
jgi:endonuclease/exonuclease/phosphatase family metal-dependent hydrolase